MSYRHTKSIYSSPNFNVVFIGCFIRVVSIGGTLRLNGFIWRKKISFCSLVNIYIWVINCEENFFEGKKKNFSIWLTLYKKIEYFELTSIKNASGFLWQMIYHGICMNGTFVSRFNAWEFRMIFVKTFRRMKQAFILMNLNYFLVIHYSWKVTDSRGSLSSNVK